MRLEYTRAGWQNRHFIVAGKTLRRNGETVEVDDKLAKSLLAEYPDELAVVKTKKEDADNKAAPSTNAQSPAGQSAKNTHSTTRKGD